MLFVILTLNFCADKLPVIPIMLRHIVGILGSNSGWYKRTKTFTTIDKTKKIEISFCNTLPKIIEFAPVSTTIDPTSYFNYNPIYALTLFIFEMRAPVDDSKFTGLKYNELLLRPDTDKFVVASNQTVDWKSPHFYLSFVNNTFTITLHDDGLSYLYDVPPGNFNMILFEDNDNQEELQISVS